MAARAQTLILLLAACCLPAASRTHVYDALNRIESVTESGAASWSRSFTYDRYGNRAATGFQVTVATPPAATSTYYTAATNRLATDWASYDDAGNMTAFENPNGTSDGQWSAAYDGENKQRYYCDGTIAACGAANKTGEYVYDGEGNRVLKMVTGGATTTYVYDAFGRLAAEYTVGGPSETAGTFYRTTDHLGSTRLVTDASGNVVSRRDFFPFGEEIPASSSSGRIISGSGYNEDMGFPQLFTAKERDVESGLDYFGARYFGSSFGRFTSPDAPFADQQPTNPQTWNLYAYVRNNPVRLVDRDGKQSVEAVIEIAIEEVDRIARPLIESASQGARPAGLAGGAALGAAALALASPGTLGAPELQVSPYKYFASSGDPEDPDFVGPPKPPTPQKKRSGRGKNRVDPDPKAKGPHSVAKRDADGNVTGYTEFAPTDPRNPNPFEPVKRYDGTGKEHTNSKTGQPVPTPHVNEKATPGGVRPPRPEEIPRRREEDENR